MSVADRTTRGTYWYDLAARRPGPAAVKRVIDIFGSLFLIVLFAPLFVAIVVLGKLSGRGAAVIVERRLGFRCNPFDMYRFRTTTKLDDLPQLFNVLEGSMSLVGPRPLLASDAEFLPLCGAMRRFSVRPGMTGLWKISRRRITPEKEQRLDRAYVNRWSLRLDARILARTRI